MAWKTKEQARMYSREYRKKNLKKVRKWEYKRNHSESRKNYLKSWRAKRYKKAIGELRDYKKLIGKCQKCGWDKETDILQFHHLKDKSFTFSQIDIANYSKETIEKEIKKCKLLCPNCHMLLHYKEQKR